MGGFNRLARPSCEAATRFTRQQEYVCKSCQRQLSLNATLKSRQVRHASTSLAEQPQRGSSPSARSGAQRSWIPGGFRRKPRATVEEEKDEETEEGSKFQPAETWDNLRHLGHTGHWTNTAFKQADSIKPWHLARLAKDHTKLPALFYQAVIECLALRHESIGHPTTSSIEPVVQIHTKSLLIDAQGFVSGLQSSTEDSQEHSNQLSKIDADSYESISTESLQALLSAKLDPMDSTTFQILKRFSQISGRVLPDPVLGKFMQPAAPQPIAFLLDALQEEYRPKPKNVAETLMHHSDLPQIANLKISEKRETLVTREQEIGRWSLIRDELFSRGLPPLERERRFLALKERTNKKRTNGISEELSTMQIGPE